MLIRTPYERRLTINPSRRKTAFGGGIPLRGIALGRKSWLFAGSDRGGQRAAVMYSMIVSAKMHDVDPQAWLAHVLASIAQHPASRLDELLPWNWHPHQAATRLAA